MDSGYGFLFAKNLFSNNQCGIITLDGTVDSVRPGQIGIHHFGNPVAEGVEDVNGKRIADSEMNGGIRRAERKSLITTSPLRLAAIENCGRDFDPFQIDTFHATGFSENRHNLLSANHAGLRRSFNDSRCGILQPLASSNGVL